MRKRSFWLAIGLALGAAINNSIIGLALGLGLTLAPYAIVSIMHISITFEKWLWDESRSVQKKFTSTFMRPEELDAFEYQRFYDTGELPERWQKYEARRGGLA